MLLPYRVDVSIRRWPVANMVILGVLLVVFYLEYVMPADLLRSLVLYRKNPFGLIGCLFVHAGPWHLAGNMIFLWVFGNAVCVRVGNAAYALIFLALGIVSGLAHLASSDMPALGASGAINGIVGMFLVWYPVNRLSVFYFWLFGMGTFEIRSYWMILLWLAFDIIGAALGWGSVAYWAHLGGFAAGFGLAFYLLASGRIKPDPSERSLLQLLSGAKAHEEEFTPRPWTAPAPSAARVEADGPAAPRSTTPIASLAPPEGYFVSFACTCGAELRAPRKRAGEEIICPKCSARAKVPGP